MAENKLNIINDLILSCFLPELKQDLDSLSIQTEHFIQYHQQLEIQLPILFDLYQQYQQLIYKDSDEDDYKKIQINLLLLLCELTASNAEYKLQNDNLLKNAERILQQILPISDVLEKPIIKYFQEKLQQNCWKRKLGSIHGFKQFLEKQFSENNNSNYHMSINWLSFCLSIGLTVHECHLPQYKQLSIRIFQIILKHGNFADIQNMNIHSVIYDAVNKNIYSMESVDATNNIWSTLLDCLDYFQNIDTFTWNYVDDLLDMLLRNIPLVSNTLISICLLKFVTKLGCYFAINRYEIEMKYNADLRISKYLNDCRDICFENTSQTSYRWTKSILEMFIVESYKLMSSQDTCEQLLLEMHRCYMVCIMPIPLQIIEAQLLEFIPKFISVLMEVIATHSQAKEIVQIVKNMLITFNQQLEHSTYTITNLKYKEIHDALKQLLKLELFL